MRAEHCGPDRLADPVEHPVVVVDVLRAFTTAAFVLAGGASRLVLCATDDDALRTKRLLGPGTLAVKDGALVGGFDLGNSPGQVRDADLRGRSVVQRTTNGTVAAHRALGARAPLVLCASLVNASATARALRDRGVETVAYLVTGDDGRADEDLACAELVHALATGATSPPDVRRRVEESAAAQDLRRGIAAGYRGIHRDDVTLVCATDAVGFAMAATVEHGRVRVRRLDVQP